MRTVPPELAPTGKTAEPVDSNRRQRLTMTSTSSKIGFTKGVAVSIKIAAIYFLLGVLWILLSDKILGMLVRDQALLTNVSIIKGLFYVSVTALMLYVLISRGVSQIEQAGKEARLSEAKYRELVESANSIIMRRDITGRITFMNEFGQDFFGYSKDEILGRNVIGTIVPEVERSGRDLKEMIEDIGKHPERYTNNENENMRANGERVWIAWTNRPIWDENGQIKEVLCIGNDISERKITEDKLQNLNTFLDTIIENSPHAMWISDDNGTLIRSNHAMRDLFKIADNDMVGKYNLFQDDILEAQGYIPLVKEVFEKGRTVKFTLDYDTSLLRQLNLAQTVFVSLDVTISPILDTDGRVTNAIVQEVDITERKQAEEALLLHAERVQALLNLNQMTDATLQEITDYALEGAVRLTQSKIGYMAFLNDDETILTMHSWSKGAMLECAIAHKPVDFNAHETGLWGEAVRQRRMVITNDYAAPNPLKKGYPVGHVAVQRHMSVPVFVGPHIVLVTGVGNKNGDYDENDAQQLTLFMEGMWRLIERKQAEEERKKLEGQLFQAQKIESVGRLAGGVAHDFNNMLGVIIGRAEMALEENISKDKLQESLQEILKAGLRSADLTRQLLAFARKQTAIPKILDLNDTISGILKMLRRLIGEDIDLLWAPELDLWKVKIDPSQVDQILANLVVNARDAISGVGAITLRTENVAIADSLRAEQLEFIPGEYVQLTVSDNGEGMSREVLENIFEPFFTTKELGKGTGLGLSTVYGIVKQNDGFIQVASEPGKGTTFKIHLPRFEVETAQVSFGEITAKRPTGTETILVVEDDEAILNLSKIILENLGYTVLAAHTPVYALHLVAEHTGDLHLLITDVVMPGMNGRALAEQLRASRSNLKCLYMSGYTGDIITHRGLLDDGVNFIQKPFGADDFAAKVREVLDRRE